MTPGWLMAQIPGDVSLPYPPAMPSPTLADLADLARQAGAILADGYGKNFAIARKGRVDLVTEYDKKSEDFLIDRKSVV